MSTTNVNTAAFYRYDPDANNFRGLALRENAYAVVRIHSSFASVAPEWKEILLEELDDSPPKLGDFPSLVDRRRIPLFSARAWDVFKSHLSDTAEALPATTTKGNRLFVVHVYRPSDAVLSERCELDRFSDGGVRRVKKFCFDQTKCGGVLMMKLPPELGGDLLVSDKFRRMAEENGLEGLLFTAVPQLD